MEEGENPPRLEGRLIKFEEVPWRQLGVTRSQSDIVYEDCQRVEKHFYRSLMRTAIVLVRKFVIPNPGNSEAGTQKQVEKEKPITLVAHFIFSVFSYIFYRSGWDLTPVTIDLPKEAYVVFSMQLLPGYANARWDGKPDGGRKTKAAVTPEPVAASTEDADGLFNEWKWEEEGE